MLAIDTKQFRAAWLSTLTGDRGLYVCDATCDNETCCDLHLEIAERVTGPILRLWLSDLVVLPSGDVVEIQRGL